VERDLHLHLEQHRDLLDYRQRRRNGSPAAPLFFAAATMVLTVVALGAFRWIERRRSTSPRP